jgi:hypothetical protein
LVLYRGKGNYHGATPSVTGLTFLRKTSPVDSYPYDLATVIQPDTAHARSVPGRLRYLRDFRFL